MDLGKAIEFYETSTIRKALLSLIKFNKWRKKVSFNILLMEKRREQKTLRLYYRRIKKFTDR